MVEETMDGGKPYKLWSADMYRCDKCNTRVIGNFGATPFAEHFQKDYRSIKATRNEAGVYIEGIGFARSYSTKGKKSGKPTKERSKVVWYITTED